MSFYVVPFVGSGTRADPYRPKYVPELGIGWAAVDFQSSAVVWANATPAQDAAIAANPDALVVPPIDNSIAVNATQSALEGLNIPAHWITSGMTYRTVLRVVVGMAQLFQRVSAILGTQVSAAGNLDKTISSLSATVRNAIAQACDELSIDRTSIVGSTTVREALRMFGQQFAQRGVSLGDL